MPWRRSLTVSLAIAFLAFAAGAAGTQEPPGFQQAHEFWEALVKTDVKALKGLYAPQVLVNGGSTLLAGEWGLSPRGDAGKEQTVARAELLTAFEAMVGRFGKDAWKDVFARIKPEEVRIGISSRANDPFPGVRAGDVLLRVAVGRQADKLVFALRPDEHGRWSVVAESTRY